MFKYILSLAFIVYGYNNVAYTSRCCSGMIRDFQEQLQLNPFLKGCSFLAGDMRCTHVGSSSTLYDVIMFDFVTWVCGVKAASPTE